MDAVGAVDEASAALGLARAMCRTVEAQTILQVQRDLYGLMAETAATTENAARFRAIDPQRLAWLEEQTNRLTGLVKLPGEFIVPGDTPAGGALDLARTIVRRAERRMVALFRLGGIENPILLQYLNRLSSFCYVLELYELQAGEKSGPTLARG
jgi:cob(I)alamin adenosyltransferase